MTTRSDQRGDLIALLGRTTRVYDDCSFPNGALIAAPSHFPSYPRTAPDGLACVPGQLVPLAILAMDALGRDVRVPLCRWVLARAEGIVETGLPSLRHQVHGPALVDEPDVAGGALMLLAICARPERARVDVPRQLARLLASALAVGAGSSRGRAERSSSPLVLAAEAVLGLKALRAAASVYEIEEWALAAENAEASVRETITFATEVGPEAIHEAVDDGDSENGRSNGGWWGPVSALLTLCWPFGARENDQPIATREKLLSVAARAVGRWEASDSPGNDITTDIADFKPIQPAHVFWFAAAAAANGRDDVAERAFDFAVCAANLDGDFPAFIDNQLGAFGRRPDLATHLLFVIAAAELGRLRDIPRDGYTSARRRA